MFVIDKFTTPEGVVKIKVEFSAYCTKWYTESTAREVMFASLAEVSGVAYFGNGMGYDYYNNPVISEGEISQIVEEKISTFS